MGSARRRIPSCASGESAYGTARRFQGGFSPRFHARTDGRVVECARLESVCAVKRTEGSNPSLSAISNALQPAPCFEVFGQPLEILLLHGFHPANVHIVFEVRELHP